MKKCIFITLVFVGCCLNVLYSQVQQTMGLMQYDSGAVEDGYVLFAPIQWKTTHLIDKCGREVHSWPSVRRPGLAVHLMEDGTLLRTEFLTDGNFLAGGKGGIIEKIDWNGNVTWSYRISDSSQCQHHDAIALPNGNILTIAWEKKTVAETVLAGCDTSLYVPAVWGEKIIELQPVGFDSAVVVWEWHTWDHLNQDFDSTKQNYVPVANNPRLFNLNFRQNINGDLLHLNALDYHPVFDQILVSNHNFGEIFIIDHSTTTAEAASHSGGKYNKGGDILYRWGNPAAYKHGSANDRILGYQHNAHWIIGGPDSGKIMVFNNVHPLALYNYSSVEIIDPPVDSFGVYDPALPYLPDSSYWTYTDSFPSDFYAPIISGAQQLPNGNVLICDGTEGRFFEIDSFKNKVWEYINPVMPGGPGYQGDLVSTNEVFRSPYYPATFSGFANRVLTPGFPVELDPIPYSCMSQLITTSGNEWDNENDISVYPNPVLDVLTVDIMEKKKLKIELINPLGQIMLSTDKKTLDMSAIADGMYLLKIEVENENGVIKRVVKNKGK